MASEVGGWYRGSYRGVPRYAFCSSPPFSQPRVQYLTLTSFRGAGQEESLGLFDDPLLGNSALDRLAHASYHIVIEGTSYRENLSPHRRKVLTT